MFCLVYSIVYGRDYAKAQTVYLCLNNLLSTVSDHMREKVTREVKVMASLNHPNIVRYYDSWFDDWLLDSCSEVDMPWLPVGRSTAGSDNTSCFYTKHTASSSSSQSTPHMSSETLDSADSSSQSNPAAASSLSTDKVTYLYIQMELCPTGTLKHWLDSQKHNRPVDQCVKIYESVVTAVNYLHGRNFMHRDIKVSYNVSKP